MLLGTAKVIVLVIHHDTEEKPKKVSSGSSVGACLSLGVGILIGMTARN